MGNPIERRLVQNAPSGLSRAARGSKGGRWVIRADDPLVVIAKRLYQDSGLSIHQSCTTLGDFQADLLPLLGAA